MYKILRIENTVNNKNIPEIFLHAQITDDLGTYNLGYWLTKEEIELVNQDEEYVYTVIEAQLPIARQRELDRIANENKNTILKSELLGRLTDNEFNNIANYQIVINSQDITEEEKTARIMLMNKVMLKFNSYKELDLEHEDVANFSQAVIYCELITAERVAEIVE